MGLKQLLVQSNHYMNVIMPNGHTEYVSYSLKIPKEQQEFPPSGRVYWFLPCQRTAEY